MDLITAIIMIALVGVLTWAIVTYVPMPVPIARVLVIFVVVVLVLWLLRIVFGFAPPALPLR